MLFAHVAVALAACDLLFTSSRQNALAIVGQGPVNASPCHEQKSNLNLCVAHCQVEDLSLDKPQVKVHALAPLTSLTLRAVPQPQRILDTPTRKPGAWAAPPHRILFQSFLI